MEPERPPWWWVYSVRWPEVHSSSSSQRTSVIDKLSSDGGITQRIIRPSVPCSNFTRPASANGNSAFVCLKKQKQSSMPLVDCATGYTHVTQVLWTCVRACGQLCLRAILLSAALVYAGHHLQATCIHAVTWSALQQYRPSGVELEKWSERARWALYSISNSVLPDCEGAWQFKEYVIASAFR